LNVNPAIPALENKAARSGGLRRTLPLPRCGVASRPAFAVTNPKTAHKKAEIEVQLEIVRAVLARGI